MGCVIMTKEIGNGNKPIGIVVVHIEKDVPVPTYYVFGDKRIQLFIVDETTPDDRVYEVVDREDPKIFSELIPEGSVIHNSHDGRNEVISAFIDSKMEGKRHLKLVKDNNDDNKEVSKVTKDKNEEDGKNKKSGKTHFTLVRDKDE